MGTLYQACDFYMLRTPLLPLEFYKSICFSDKKIFKDEIDKILKIKEINEAIEIGSTSLLENLNQLDTNVQSSLLKYLIRMSTRTTPYGLFSGVTIGSFDSYSDIRLNNRSSFKKRMRPDMEWLYGIINCVEKDNKYFEHLKVKKNSLIYRKGDRLENPYVSNSGLIDNSDAEIVTSIRYTGVLNLIVENTQEFVEIEKLANIISEKYPDADKEKIINYLNKLVHYEYLITSLRPPLTNCKPFEYVIAKIKDIDDSGELYKQLNNINNKIREYNSQSIGDGIVLFHDIINSLKNLYNKSTYYLQVDTAISTNKNFINRSIAHDMEKYCDMLQKLGIKQYENNSIREYKKEFIEKYGTNTEVQLLELLDEDIGLGAPMGYSNPISHKMFKPDIPQDKFKKIRNYIRYKIIENNIKGNEVVQLTDDDINKMNEGEELPEEKEFSPSIEFNVIVSANQCEAIDAGDYLLFIGPNIGSGKAGKTFGRFMDLLSDDDNRKIKSIYQKEAAAIQDDYLMVEISELLQHGRGNNLTINSNNLDYQICIATNTADTKKTIDIKDLYIGVSHDRFYIKSRTLNKKLYVTCHHMLNYKNGSNLARFLKDITFGYYLTLIDISMLFQFEEFEYVPRLSYGRVVIAPALWKMKKAKFVGSYEKFEQDFNEWVVKNKVPRYVYQKKYDNRLLLDLKSPVHRRELFNILRKSSDDAVILTETEIGQDLNRVVVCDGELNHYCSEIVIPLIRKSVPVEKEERVVFDSIDTKSIISQNLGRASLQDRKRNLFPGDENWYYYKFYLSEMRMNELIGDYLYDFCERLVEKKLISKYFFIRYADPELHIRLRVRVTKGNDPLVQMCFKGFIEEMSTKGLVNSVQIENYFREFERYGGAEIIQDAEEYFYADSQYVGRLIQYKRENELDYEDVEIGIMSIVSIMEQFHVSFDDQEKLLSGIIDRNDYRDDYKKNRKKYMQFADWEAIRNKDVGSEIYDAIMKKQEETMRYRQAVDKLDESGLLCNSKESILLSMIHMFCNRFKGDREWERLVTALVRHSLYDLKLFKKSMQKKKLQRVLYE